VIAITLAEEFFPHHYSTKGILMRMHNQTVKSNIKPKMPMSLILNNPATGLLDRDFDERDEFRYSHGLIDNVDRAQGHHSPYDLEDESQDFYNRQITEDGRDL
jgi:hypothetical protein